jgi:hypothetical protein
MMDTARSFYQDQFKQHDESGSSLETEAKDLDNMLDKQTEGIYN